MKVSDLVEFRSDLFFDGAVQLNWLDQDPQQSKKAAESFVFHGSSFHGIKKTDTTEILGKYLKNSIQFSKEIIDIVSGNYNEFDHNPFQLAISGYGTGKSHLAVTLATLLNDYKENASEQILNNISKIEPEISKEIKIQLLKNNKPNLVIGFDGMGNFEISNLFYKKAIQQLKKYKLDCSAIEDLSPRFQIAIDFVKNKLNQNESSETNDKQDKILIKLEERDEATYYNIDNEFYNTYNRHIPDEGEESPQQLLSVLCREYCGEDKHFGSILIIFDEFGRYLEYVASKSHLSDDSALQQVFQGVQDNKNRCTFLGFIQYDLQAYLNRIKSKETPILLRYITRYDTAQKSYLSSNLETIFAHLLEKKDPISIKDINKEKQKNWKEVHTAINRWFFEKSDLTIWNKFDDFYQVIINGCWPLHPLTVWFFSQQQNILQNRSAISFVRDELQKLKNKNTKTACIYLSEICNGVLFEQILMSEKAQFGSIAQDYATINEQKGLSHDEQLVLISIVVASKLKIKVIDTKDYDSFISMASGLNATEIENIIHHLIDDINVLEWNKDSKQYDLITDAIPRSQFTSFLRRKIAKYDGKYGAKLFNQYAKDLYNDPNGLGDFNYNFDKDNEITTSEWRYNTFCSTDENLKDTIADCIKSWKDAIYPTESQSRGYFIYYYVSPNESFSDRKKLFDKTLTKELKKNTVVELPLFGMVLHDWDGEISNTLKKYHVLNKQLSKEEKAKYSHFIDIEILQTSEQFQTKIKTSLQLQNYIFPKFLDEESFNSSRRKQIGDQIFSQIYNKIIEFPFDGYKAMSGVAAKNCAEISRALLLSQLNDDWIRSKDTSLRNRTVKLLAKTWGMLDDSGSLSLLPSHKQLAKIVIELETALKDKEELNVEEIVIKLIQPPYGMNLASAGLVLSFFMGKSAPAKRLNYGETDILISDWLQIAIVKNYFDLEKLKFTKVIYVSDDIVGQWEELLNDWELETTHKKSCDFADKAKERLNTFSIPNNFLERYKRLVLKTEISEIAISKFEKEMVEIEQRIERAESKQDVNNIAYCGKLLLVMRNKMVNEKCWASEQFDDVEDLLENCKSLLENDSFFQPWLKHQHCFDSRALGDFKHYLVGQTANSLQSIGLNKLGDQVKEHFRKISENIDESQKIKTVIDDAQNFLKLKKARDTSSIQELDDWIDQANDMIKILNTSVINLGKESVSKLISKLEEKKSEFIHMKTYQTSRLNELTQIDIQSIDAVDIALEELQRLHFIFSGKKDDLEYLNDIEKQLKLFQEDTRKWELYEGTPEELANVAKEKIKARLVAEEENEEDFVWESKDVYKRLLKILFTSRMLKSREWLEQNGLRPLQSKNIINIHDFDKYLDTIRNTPVYVSQKDKQYVKELEKTLISEKEKFQVKLNKHNATNWMRENITTTNEISELTIDQCTVKLNKLASVPIFLDAKDLGILTEHREKIFLHKDKLDFDGFLSRLEQFPIEKKKQVMSYLEKSFEILN
jgi:hypothetical protein